MYENIIWEILLSWNGNKVKLVSWNNRFASDVGLVETMELPKEMKQVSGYRHDEKQALENNKIKSVQHKVQSFVNFNLMNV